jgi:hypothetical protein
MRFKLTAVLLLLCSVARSQGMYGFQGGVGYTTSYKSHITPAFEGYYLYKAGHRIYAGGSVFFQKYSFTDEVTTGGPVNYGDLISITQKTSYAFISAKVDYGIGYRKHVHISLAFGPGLLLGGSQYANEHLPYWTTASGVPFGADTAGVNTSYNIPAVIYRAALGISERISTGGYWNIMLSQEFSFIPVNMSKNGPPLNTGYISFQVGIMHKYPMVFVEY